MSATTTSTFPSYAAIQEWLLEELGEVPVQTLLKYHPPARLGDLSSLTQQEANDRLKRLFIDTFVPQADYERQLDYLAALMPRETRTKINSPLPSTDFLMLLTSTPGVNWLQRAARLCFAATDLHQQFMRGDLSTRSLRSTVRQSHLYDNIFGVSVVPGPSEHSMVLSKESRSCNVLFRGYAHSLQLIDEDGTARPAEQLVSDLSHIVDQALPQGGLGYLRTIPLNEAFDLYQQLDAAALDSLAGALFTLCLDELPPEESKAWDLNARATAMFSGNRHNRWYGSFQVVVCDDAEAAFMFSYMCGVEGAQASEVAEELFHRSEVYTWRESASSGATPARVQRITLELPSGLPEQIEQRSSELFHPFPSIFVLPMGLHFFRRLGMSPNVTIQLVLMMAIADVGGLKHLPETSQAVLVRENCSRGVQLDWLRVRPEPLRAFMDCPDNLSLFLDAVIKNKSLIQRCKEQLSPFLFFDNPFKESHRDLIEYFLALGQEEPVGAYRHYLCPMSRDPRALDFITSGVVLGEGVVVVGRPGTRSRLVSISGSHTTFREEEVLLAFTPTRGWDHRMGEVVERARHWLRHLEALVEAAGR